MFDRDLFVVEKFNNTHWYAGNVLSHEQIDAYGSYDAAKKALGMELFLFSQVSVDSTMPLVEMGHC